MSAPGSELDLLVLGDVNPDLVVSDPALAPAFDQVESLVSDAELAIGGSGAIAACAAARLGLRTAIAGVVGDDLFGRFMTDALARRGVDVSRVLVDPERRTGLTVVLARGADRAILTFAGAIASPRAGEIDAAALAAVRHVHVAAYFLQSGLWPGVGELLAAARRAGATTSLDPNWDPAGTWDSGLAALLPEIDVLLPNAAEARRLAGLADSADIADAARALAGRGPLVAVKLGADGALAVDGPDGAVVRCRPPAVAPVDTVGAGDTFDAGFLAARLDGEDVGLALALACACGALSTQGTGGTAAQPTLRQARAARG